MSTKGNDSLSHKFPVELDFDTPHSEPESSTEAGLSSEPSQLLFEVCDHCGQPGRDYMALIGGARHSGHKYCMVAMRDQLDFDDYDSEWAKQLEKKYGIAKPLSDTE